MIGTVTHGSIAGRIVRAVSAAILICLTAGVAQAQDSRYPDRVAGKAKVLAPDVIAVGKHLVQLFGVDAPEERQACITHKGNEWNCALAATKTLLDLVGDFDVVCEARMPPRLRRIYAECKVGDTNVNESLVRAGLAMVVRDETEDYVPAEEEARAAQRGIWSGDFMAPWDYRKTPAGARQPLR